MFSSLRTFPKCRRGKPPSAPFSFINGFFFVAATRAEVDTDIALYIGLAVALAVFTFLVIFIYRLLRRKGRDHSMYNMAVSGKDESLKP